MDDHGYHPLGKYSSARDDLLHFMCMSEWANESTGHSESPIGYIWKLSNEPAEVQQSNTEVSSLFAEWFELNPEVVDSAELRAELVGDFIVSTNEQGFVFVEPFDTRAARDAEYARREELFAEWDDDEL